MLTFQDNFTLKIWLRNHDTLQKYLHYSTGSPTLSWKTCTSLWCNGWSNTMKNQYEHIILDNAHIPGQFYSAFYSELTYYVDWLLCRFLQNYTSYSLSQNNIPPLKSCQFLPSKPNNSKNPIWILPSVWKIFEVRWVYRISGFTVSCTQYCLTVLM